MHPQEHKEKTINYILTPAVKCWHLVLKKSCKICFLKPRKCGKAGLPASAAVSCRGSKLRRKRSGCQRKHCCFHTQEQTVCRGQQQRDRDSGAEPWNCSSLPISKPEPSERRPSPRAPAVLLISFFQVHEPRDFSGKGGGSPDK